MEDPSGGQRAKAARAGATFCRTSFKYCTASARVLIDRTRARIAGRSVWGETVRSCRRAAWTIPGRLPSFAESAGRETGTVAAALAIAAANGATSEETTSGRCDGASFLAAVRVSKEVKRLAAASRCVNDFKTEQRLQRRWNGSMVVQPVIDQVSGTERGDDQRRNARSILFKSEAIYIVGRFGICVTGRDSIGGNRMIEEPAVLVPGDDQQAGFPKSGIADSLVSGFDESFATIYVASGCCEVPFL